MIEQRNLQDTIENGKVTKTKEDKAKEILQSAAPFVEKGITDVSKINGLLNTFKEFIDKIRICAFEISKIEFKNNTYKVPKQENSLKTLI